MNIDKRLTSAASMVRHGVRFADIGSDHAYLPIYLCEQGKIDVALASDINEGPVRSAAANINEHGLASKITAIRADGLDGAQSFAPDDIAILGMGGELIISIIDKAPWVRDRDINLILQPMTHAELLYRYLLEAGFCIADELICSTSAQRTDRMYRLIKASFCGEKRDCDDVEALVGKVNIERYKSTADPIVAEYIRHTMNVLTTRLEGKRRAGLDTENEEKLISGLCALL